MTATTTDRRRAKLAGRPICRHCNAAVVTRPRGLCWGCSKSPDVRALYPSTSKYCNRGWATGAGPLPPPAAPTDAPPGTPEKIAVMESRAAAGRQVFHEADARYEGDPRPALWLAAHTKGETA